MSSDENQENQENQEPTETKTVRKQQGTATDINITLDRNAEIEALNKRNAELQTQLESAALERFAKECEKYDLDPADTTPAVLNAVRIMKENALPTAPKQGETAQLSSQYQDLYNPPKLDAETTDRLNVLNKDVPVDMLAWSSEQAMVEGMRKISRDTSDPRQKQAQKYLTALANKIVLQKKQEYELETSLTELGKLEKERKKMKWKKVEDGE